MDEAKVIAGEINETPEVVTKVLRQVEVRIENNKRQPKPPAPEGGISQSEASRKYGVGQKTISGWRAKGYIQRLNHPSKREVYILESDIARLAEIYHENPGQGKRTIKQGLNTF